MFGRKKKVTANINGIAKIIIDLKYPDLKILAENLNHILIKDSEGLRKDVKDLTNKDMVDILHNWAYKELYDKPEDVVVPHNPWKE